MPRLRFSLLSLVLASLWLAALIGVYVRRDPWVKDERVYTEADLRKYFPVTESNASPDGTRLATMGDKSVVGVDIFDRSNNCRIMHFGQNQTLGDPVFVDNDTLLVSPSFDIAGNDPPLVSPSFNVVEEFEIWHRRYPEWWWGHFYRVEVWLAVLIPLFAIGQVVVSRRPPRRTTPAPQPSPPSS